MIEIKLEDEMIIECYICSTPNHLFLSLIRIMQRSDCRSLLLLSDLLDEGAYELLSFYDCQILTYSEKQINAEWLDIKKKNIFSIKKSALELINNLEEFPRLKEVNRFKVFLDSNPLVVSCMMTFKSSEFVLLEDGESLYGNPRKGVSHWFKKLIGFPLPYGQSREIVKIEASFPERLPRKITHKSVCVTTQVLLDKLSVRGRSELLDFYGVKSLFSEITTCKSLILLTQPLSEDGLISEEDKIDLYKRILEEQKGEFCVYIKPHPREKTDYMNSIDGVNVLSCNWPAELLYFEGVVFDKAVTYFSTAIHAIPAKEKIFLGLKYNDQVKLAWLKFTDKKNKR